MTGPHGRLQKIDIAGGGSQGEVTGERDRRSATAIGPRMTGRGITRESPPPRIGRRWTIGRRRMRDGSVKRRAAALTVIQLPAASDIQKTLWMINFTIL